ncbi:hypothetical protein HAP41_0000043190 [Bradyrhizobium barranii subsp. apii]|uniref:Uncharacterized protein n=1 Tax=Bradyrhizobium barranii subsp. apii TaxID=2819348 RepID=A0A8T5V5N1_9BRAD|nr:hypothetical protein [Bradyrhizobium barranii]UPT86953.1 hypothetical protein HAP41_0000043190 [Bradyrhizobium barranii subsp. apii]
MQNRFVRPLILSVIGIVLVAVLIVGTLFVANRYAVQPFAPKTDTSSTAGQAKTPQQTEAYFTNGLKSQASATDEWWGARSDHRLLAYAVFSCKKLSDVVLDAMPRQYFSALLLDLAPSGNHVFVAKEGEEALLATRDKDVKPLVLTGTDQDLLSLSDSIARARLSAADGANSNVPWVQRLGVTTLIISALATLFVTLQGKTRAVELSDEDKKTLDKSSIGVRFSYALWGPGSGFRWVAFLAIALSITGTSLTGLKQVYDPTRILTQNTRALLDLRQLHQEVILSVKCDAKESRAAVDSNKMTDWINAIRRIRATILPEYGAYANLDVGGSSQRFEPTSNQSRGAPAETQGQDQTAPAGPPTPPANK